MNRKSKGTAILVPALVLITLFFPGFETMEHACQTGLWTSNVYPPEKAAGFAVKLGGDIGYSFETWNRIRLGFPFKPVTIDIQREYSIVQARIEPDAIIVNIVCMGIAGFGLFFITVGMGKLIAVFRSAGKQ